MSEAFLKIVNMSISAGWLVLAVLALRLILKKAPKWVNVLLWGIVAVRLICPFSIESALSLIPSAETIPVNIGLDTTPTINSGISSINDAVNPLIGQSNIPVAGASVNPLQITIAVYANLWVLGLAAMLIYTAISYLTLRRNLKTAVILRGNIFQCETVSSPFVLGILKPRIYLPYTIDDKDLAYVVAHEQAHIRRKDHWWKPLGFLLLTIHWFNPLMWVAYILLCRDIELACDEKVISELGNEQRADYTQALVACAVNRRMIAACPLAFGEVGVKDRVKSIMNYRKPTFWIIVTALAVCAVVVVCFLTDPKPSREFSMNGNNVSSLDPEAIVERIMDIESIDNSNVYVNTSNFPIQVDSDFNWANSQTVTYFFWKNGKSQSSQLRIYPEEDQYFLTEPEEWPEQQEIFLLRHYLDALKYLPQYEIQQIAPADQYIIQHVAQGRPSDYDRVISYSSDGVQETVGWYIHLRIEPLHATDGAYHGTGEEVIDVFYGDEVVSNAIYDSKVFAAYKDDVVGTVSSVENIEPIATQNGDILILQNEGGLWHFNEGQQIDISVFFENDGSSMSMKSIGYIYCGDGSKGLYANEIFADQNVPQSNGSFTVPETGNYLFYFRNYSTSWLTLQNFNVVYRNDLEVDKIVMVCSDGHGIPSAESTITNSEEIIQILSLYQSLQVEDYSRPLSDKRMVIQFYQGDDIVLEWTVSYYEEDDEIVTCGDAFGLGNRRVTSEFNYNWLLDLFENASVKMIPTNTDLLGCPAGALLVPIDGNVYRYELSEGNPEGVTVYKLLYTFTEETHIEGIVWEVYSLKEYPDKTAVLMLSGTNSAWLCRYSPPARCSEYALNQAMAAGYVVMEDGIGTSGQEIWNEFYDSVQQGKAASVTVVHYFTLDPERCDSVYYEVYSQDYPCLYECHLEYDGKTFTLTEPDGNDVRIRTFEYLMKYDNTDFYSQSSQTPGRRFDYVLTHDNRVTWEHIWNGLVSSYTGADIDHYSIYSERID